MEHTITPTLEQLSVELEKYKAIVKALTEERDGLKVSLRNESKKVDRELIENSVLDSIIDKLIEAIK